MQDRQGATALMYASQNNSVSTLRHLLQNGVALNIQAKEGETALIVALESNSHGALSILIDHGADLTQITPSKRSLLHTAAEFGDETSLSILTSACIRRIGVHQKDKGGTTAWNLARARNDISPAWRAAFADLVAGIDSSMPDPTADADSLRSRRVISGPRVRLSDLICVAEDKLYLWAIQANEVLNVIIPMSFSAGFPVLIVVLAITWRIFLGF